MKKKLFIPCNVPSSKNSRRVIHAKGRMMFFHSKLVVEYIKNTRLVYLGHRHWFCKDAEGMQYPLRVSFQFVRPTKRKFDLINACQIVQDLMVKNKWIPDDDYMHLVPVFLPTIVDPRNPGVYVQLIADD